MMSNEITIAEYVPALHDVKDLALEQNQAVDAGEAQMLKWHFETGELQFPHEYPFYLALLGDLAVAGAGFNIQYDGTNCVELGGAYVTKAHRGKGLYHMLTEARMNYAQVHSLDVITFANEMSSPILLSDFGFIKAVTDDVPKEAFDLCAACNSNPQKPLPACMVTCCDGDSILKFERECK